jgi:hypothetical protein
MAKRHDHRSIHASPPLRSPSPHELDEGVSLPRNHTSCVGIPCVAGSAGGAKRGWSSGSKNTSAGVGDDWRVLYVARWVWIFGWNGVRELDG